jgi:putative copper resistance protein D
MIALARFFQFASTMILFGSSLFYLYGFETAAAPRWPKILLAAAAPVALVSLIVWIALQGASMTGDLADAFDTDLLWTMLTETGFGKVLLFRLIVTALACLALLALWKTPLRTLARVQALFGFVLVASFAGVGHAAVGEGSQGAWRSTIDALHLLSSGVWIGALIPLALLVSHASVGDRGDAARAHYALAKFSGIGTAVVVFLVHSGIVNTWFMVGRAPLVSLFTTAYGILLLAKIGMFLSMLALAAANRFWLTPRLSLALVRGGPVSGAGALLKLSVFTETALALLVLVAVAFLGTMEPPGT